MLLSIIIPFYNSVSTFSRLLLSISEHIDNSEAEIIIIDDHSTDNSLEFIKNTIKNRNIKNIKLLENEINRGPSYARNKGLKESRGEYIAFLDSDDAWHTKKIDTQIAMMQKYGVLICGTKHRVIREEDFEICRRENVDLCKTKVIYIKWPWLLFKSPFATPSVVIHRNLKNYFFDENMRYSEDYNLWVRVIHSHPGIRIEYPLTFTFKHDYLSEQGSLSSSLLFMQSGSNKNFLFMLRNRNFNIYDKFFIFLGFLFSQIKFVYRLISQLFIKPLVN